MRYEWDIHKSARNALERDLPFDQAKLIDLDAAWVEQDTRRDYGEERYVAYGFIDKRLHV